MAASARPLAERPQNERIGHVPQCKRDGGHRFLHPSALHARARVAAGGGRGLACKDAHRAPRSVRPCLHPRPFHPWSEAGREEKVGQSRGMSLLLFLSFPICVEVFPRSCPCAFLIASTLYICALRRVDIYLGLRYYIYIHSVHWHNCLLENEYFVRCNSY
jgi:hypothetical protein